MRESLSLNGAWELAGFDDRKTKRWREHGRSPFLPGGQSDRTNGDRLRPLLCALQPHPDSRKEDAGEFRVGVEKSYGDGKFTVSVAADGYLHCAMITGLPDLARPDDDYFEVFPGETRTIAVRNIDEAQADSVGVRDALADR